MHSFENASRFSSKRGYVKKNRFGASFFGLSGVGNRGFGGVKMGGKCSQKRVIFVCQRAKSALQGVLGRGVVSVVS